MFFVFCCILMQGLVNVVIDVFPEAEHRWCARHFGRQHSLPLKKNLLTT